MKRPSRHPQHWRKQRIVEAFEILHACGISGRRIQDVLGVSQPTLHRWRRDENGYGFNPSPRLRALGKEVRKQLKEEMTAHQLQVTSLERSVYP